MYKSLFSEKVQESSLRWLNKVLDHYALRPSGGETGCCSHPVARVLESGFIRVWDLNGSSSLSADYK